jgi:hypothetical protein
MAMNVKSPHRAVQENDSRPWFETWLMGKGEYAHPALRWAAMPLFRVAIVLFLVNVAAGSHFWSLGWAVDTVLLVVSVSAGIVNAVIMRTRRLGR